MLSFEHEIFQTGNDNSTTRLWLQPNGLVYKQYVLWNSTTFHNILSLLFVGRNPNLRRIPQIVTPTRIVYCGPMPVGYLMEYCPGPSLWEYLYAPMVSESAKRECFQNLADVINRMPCYIFVGDLHGGNVIVSEDNYIRIIDVDGFSFPGNEISCPMAHVPGVEEAYPMRKYWHHMGKFRISRDSDILCFFRLFLQWLMGGIDPISYTSKEILRYICYLETVGFPIQIVQMMSRLFDEAPNMLTPEPFGQIDVSQLSNYTYSAYRAWEASSSR